MPKFRRIPTETEAEQYTGESSVKGICNERNCYCADFAHVHTIHGSQVVKLAKGDWVLPEPDGVHYYPVKDEVFRANYEEITQKGENKITKAVNRLRYALADDSDLYYAYQSNIAMAFVDAWRWEGDETQTEVLHKTASEMVNFHSIANRAAKYFLDQFIGDCKTPDNKEVK